MPRLSVIIITYNEARNLPACLLSLEGVPADLWVVDSGSTDGTVGIARRGGATVLHHPFETHSKQWKWALESVPLRTRWVLALDADNRLTPGLREELRSLFARGRPDPHPACGYYAKRKYFLRGRWLRFGELYPKHILRLFRRDRVFVDPAELVDHHFYIRGPTGFLEHPLIEDNVRDSDLAHWRRKNESYARLQATEEFLRRRAPRAQRARPSAFGTPHERLEWRRRLWERMPRYLRPALYFAYRYFLRGGFLDGQEGLLFHWVQALQYRLLVDRHLGRLERDHRGEARSRSTIAARGP